MSLLPMEIINTILSYQGKEYYWDRFTQQWRIRFIRKYLDEKFSYLFKSISHNNFTATYEVFEIIFIRNNVMITYLNHYGKFLDKYHMIVVYMQNADGMYYSYNLS